MEELKIEEFTVHLVPDVPNDISATLTFRPIDEYETTIDLKIGKSILRIYITPDFVRNPVINIGVLL